MGKGSTITAVIALCLKTNGGRLLNVSNENHFTNHRMIYILHVTINEQWHLSKPDQCKIIKINATPEES